MIKKPAKEKHSIYQSSFYRYKKRQSPLRWVLLCTLISCVMLYVSPLNASSIEKQQNFSPNQVSSGHLLLKNESAVVTQLESLDKQKNTYQSAILLDSAADFDINGMIATVTVTQAFMNQTDQMLNGTYAFPLPENSAISYMHIQVGERLIEGTIMEKSNAKKVFNQAKKTGHKASLVAQHRPNLFTNQIANIPAGEQVTVTIKYVNQVEFKEGSFNLRFPMTYTPRYQSKIHSTIKNNTSLASVFLDQEIQASSSNETEMHIYNVHDNQSNNVNLSPVNNALNIQLTVALNAGVVLSKISSPSHTLSLKDPKTRLTSRRTSSITELPKESQRFNFRVGNVQVPMDKDFILTWQPAVNAMPQLSVFKQKINHEHYLLAMLLPPTANNNEEGKEQANSQFSRDMTFIIDTSGSMQGESMLQAIAGLRFAISTLTSNDSFNIIAFDSSYQKAFPSTVMATSEHLFRAEAFINRLSADGGTEMFRPLEEALNMPMAREQNKEAVRQIIFLTDGAVSNEQGLFTLIKSAQRLPRLFTVGIGSAPNGYFMRKAAQFGQGSYTYIADINNVSEKMSVLFDKISRPVLRQIKAQFQPLHLGAIEQYPKKVPDLYHGEPLLIAFRTKKLPSSVELFGELASHGWHQEVMFPAKANDIEHQGVSSIWARAKIEDLLDGLITGKTLAEVKPKVIETSVLHQIMSPYTSFIAVEKIITPPKQQVNEKLPLLAEQLLARKASTVTKQKVSMPFPKTSLGWQRQLAVGILLFLLTWLLIRLNQRAQVK